MHKYLFLDFDGVMHPGCTGTFVRAPLLFAWLLQHPDVQVVITSSWRASHDIDELRSCFSAGFDGQRIVAVTPELHGERHAREAEILKFLQELAPGPVAIAALDDEARLFSPGCPWLVLTNPREGLREADLDAAARLLIRPSLDIPHRRKSAESLPPANQPRSWRQRLLAVVFGSSEES